MWRRRSNVYVSQLGIDDPHRIHKDLERDLERERRVDLKGASYTEFHKVCHFESTLLRELF